MELLKSLGVNGTLWTQLACFIVSYLAISMLVLKPYLAALHERENRTVGGEESAARLLEEKNELHAEYEKQARSLNTRIKGFFEESRQKGVQDYERVVGAARSDVETTLNTNREKIANQIQGARKNLSLETPAVGAEIASKLAGKDLSL